MFTCFPHLYSKTYHKFGIFVSLLNRLLERNINTDQSNFTLDFPFTSPAAKTLLSSGSLHSSNPPSRAVTKLRLTFAGETNKSKTEARASIYGTERDQTLCKFASDTQTQPWGRLSFSRMALCHLLCSKESCQGVGGCFRARSWTLNCVLMLELRLLSTASGFGSWNRSSGCCWFLVICALCQFGVGLLPVKKLMSGLKPPFTSVSDLVTSHVDSERELHTQLWGHDILSHQTCSHSSLPHRLLFILFSPRGRETDTMHCCWLVGFCRPHDNSVFWRNGTLLRTRIQSHRRGRQKFCWSVRRGLKIGRVALRTSFHQKTNTFLAFVLHEFWNKSWFSWSLGPQAPGCPRVHHVHRSIHSKPLAAHLRVVCWREEAGSSCVRRSL